MKCELYNFAIQFVVSGFAGQENVARTSGRPTEHQRNPRDFNTQHYYFKIDKSHGLCKYTFVRHLCLLTRLDVRFNGEQRGRAGEGRSGTDHGAFNGTEKSRRFAVSNDAKVCTQ